MRPKAKQAVLLILLLTGLALLSILVSSGRPASAVVVGFIGYTNLSADHRFALFGITNGSGHPIQRLSPAVEIEGDSHPHAPGFNPALPWLPSTPVGRGDCKLLAIRVPSDGGTWRLSLRYQPRTIPEVLRDFAMSHGHPVPLTIGPVTILGPPQYCTTNSTWLKD